jgi:branched-chain amino acid transport system substrate-binding protein
MGSSTCRFPLAAVGLIFLAMGGCGGREVFIALGYESSPGGPAGGSLASVAQSAIDASREGRGPVIRVLQNPPGTTTRLQTRDLADAVDFAVRFTRTRGLIGFVGPEASSSALVTAPVFNEARIPQLVPTGTSRQLERAGPWTFMMAPSDSVEGEFIADFVAGPLGARTASIFYITEEYGSGVRTAASSGLAARGVRVLDEVPIRLDGSCSPEVDGNTYGEVVDASLGRNRPDVVVVAGRIRETACIARRLEGLYPGTPVVAGDGALPGPAMLRLAGPAIGSIYTVSLWDPDRQDPGVAEFIAKYTAAVGEPPHHGTALAWDAIMLLVEAVRATGPDPRRIRDYLLDLGRGRPPYAGVTGPIAFAGGHRHSLLMTHWSNDRVTTVFRSPP